MTEYIPTTANVINIIKYSFSRNNLIGNDLKQRKTDTKNVKSTTGDIELNTGPYKYKNNNKKIIKEL
jgi:hypothetical protein